MQFLSHLFVRAYIFVLTAAVGSSWQYFTHLSQLILTNSLPDIRQTHSQYIFGHCQSKDIVFYTHIHVDHMDVVGKIIMRAWILIPRIPTCIILRGKAYDYDMIRSTSYNFQFCVPRITYCHSHKRYKFFYYEWYIPRDYNGGMNWEIYFYGPEGLEWG